MIDITVLIFTIGHHVLDLYGCIKSCIDFIDSVEQPQKLVIIIQN